MNIDIKAMKDQINALTEKFIQRMDNNPNFLSEFVQDTGAEDLIDISFSKNFCYIEYCKYLGDERRCVTSIEHFVGHILST